MVEAISPTGARFSHAFDLSPMTMLVAQALVDNGYFEVFIVTETGERYGREDIQRPDFKLSL